MDNESNKRFTMLTVEVKARARTRAATPLADSLAAYGTTASAEQRNGAVSRRTTPACCA